MNDMRLTNEFVQPTTSSRTATIIGAGALPKGDIAERALYLVWVSQDAPAPSHGTKTIGEVADELARDDATFAEHLRQARRELAAQIDTAASLTIRGLRLNRGMSQAQLATAMNTSQSHIARIESGRNDPTFDTFQKLANALQVELGEVVSAFANARTGSMRI